MSQDTKLVLGLLAVGLGVPVAWWIVSNWGRWGQNLGWQGGRVQPLGSGVAGLACVGAYHTVGIWGSVTVLVVWIAWSRAHGASSGDGDASAPPSPEPRTPAASVPPPEPAPPSSPAPSVEAPNRRSGARSAVSWMLAVAAFVGAYYGVQEWKRERTLRAIDRGQVTSHLDLEQKSPIEFAREGYRSGGQHYLTSFARALELTWERNNPGSDVRVEPLVPVDSPATFRVGAIITGTAPVEGMAREQIWSRVHQYYHAEGAVVLDATCLVEYSKCDDAGTRLGAAEASILDNLDGSGVASVLPTDGECTVESVAAGLGQQASDVAYCVYETGTVLSVYRMNRRETLSAIASAADDPAMRALLRELVQDAR